MELSNQLITLINTVCEKMGIVIDWSQKNVIPYLEEFIQRLVSYRKAELSVQLVFEVVIILCSAFVVYKAVKRAIKCSSNWDEAVFTICAIVTIIFGFLIIFLLICVYYDVTDIIEATLIPEKYVIEVLQGMA